MLSVCATPQCHAGTECGPESAEGSGVCVVQHTNRYEQDAAGFPFLLPAGRTCVRTNNARGSGCSSACFTEEWQHHQANHTTGGVTVVSRPAHSKGAGTKEENPNTAHAASQTATLLDPHDETVTESAW
eukprot:TRINITY_DN58820_c0_g1_i1.p2 TRINITY_DN58820_c0_g1~~TRINITY_DN58820_c0_g1_i1.p2  ORF type:complete len:129 (-),score=7.20 TRINITY_DN58820_c0_g1_i1:147-533(-)